MKKLLFAILLLLAACDTADPTQAVVDNVSADPVYRAWWVTTYFPNAVAAGASSEIERTVPSSGTAYVVLAPGWDPTSDALPTKFVVLQSRAPFVSTRGDLLHITVNDDLFAGDCAAGSPLSQADADFITQSIFPGEFANATYDAATCTMKVTDSDAGTDAD